MSQSAAVICFLFGISLSAADAAETPNILFKTTPRVELLRPFADPIDLSLLITGADGRPVEGGSVALRLDAPTPGRFFSTDFPLLEGTLLNEMRLPLRQGRAAWKYLFPIRGEYRLGVEYTSEDGAKAKRVFAFRVRESRQKLWTLAGFSSALLILGFLAGRVFTRTHAALILSCLVFLSPTSPAAPHVAGESGPSSPGLEIEPPTVGRPALVHWRAAGAGSAALLSLSIVHLEKQKVVFAVDKIAVRDQWSMKFHFPDGAAYRVNAIAGSPGQSPVRSEQVIAVTAVEPPATASAPALAYFTGLIAVGLGAGRWSKRRAI